MKNDINEKLDQLHQNFDERLKVRKDRLKEGSIEGTKGGVLILAGSLKRKKTLGDGEVHSKRKVMFKIDDEDS